MLFNLEKQPGVSKQNSPMYRLYLANINDVDVDNWPLSVNAAITTDVLKTGKQWNFMDCTVESINPNVAVGESPMNGKLTLDPVIEGLTKEVLDFVYKNVGEDFIVIWERCSDRQYFIAGTPCSGGLKLSYTQIGKLETGIGGAALHFEGGECPEPFVFYDFGPLDVAP